MLRIHRQALRQSINGLTSKKGIDLLAHWLVQFCRLALMDVFCNVKIPTCANKNPQLKVGNFLRYHLYKISATTANDVLLFIVMMFLLYRVFSNATIFFIAHSWPQSFAHILL